MLVTCSYIIIISEIKRQMPFKVAALKIKFSSFSHFNLHEAVFHVVLIWAQWWLPGTQRNLLVTHMRWPPQATMMQHATPFRQQGKWLWESPRDSSTLNIKANSLQAPFFAEDNKTWPASICWPFVLSAYSIHRGIWGQIPLRHHLYAGFPLNRSIWAVLEDHHGWANELYKAEILVFRTSLQSIEVIHFLMMYNVITQVAWFLVRSLIISNWHFLPSTERWLARQ